MTACPIRYQRQVPDRKGKIFYTSITSLSHISKVPSIVISAPIDQYLCDFIQIPPAVFLKNIPFKRYIQTGICHSVSRFSSPQTQSWSSTVISDFPRSESAYSTFGGICGYSVRTISLSASSSLRFVLRVLSEMVFRYRFSSLNRTVSNSIRQ